MLLAFKYEPIELAVARQNGGNFADPADHGFIVVVLRSCGQSSSTNPAYRFVMLLPDLAPHLPQPRQLRGEEVMIRSY
jgi:hypothetical protein